MSSWLGILFNNFLTKKRFLAMELHLEEMWGKSLLSTDSEKTFDKMEHPFMIKTVNKMGIEGKYLNIIKAIDDKPSANIILNGENWKLFL